MVAMSLSADYDAKNREFLAARFAFDLAICTPNNIVKETTEQFNDRDLIIS
jgi:hypothetical protein